MMTNGGRLAVAGLTAAGVGGAGYYWYNFIYYKYVPASASAQDRLQILSQNPRVRLQGLTAQNVATLQALIAKFGACMTGILPNGVIMVNPASPVTIQLLAYLPLPPSTSAVPSPFPGVSVPGATPGEVAYLGLLAHQGNLCGITADGQPVLC